MNHLDINLALARAHYVRYAEMDDSLNIDHHRRRLLVKALNKAGTKSGAARLTGLCEKSVHRLIETYDIIQDPRTEQYY